MILELTIKQARRLCDKTQKEMAEALNVHIQTYRKIESNPGTATIDQARTIAAITGVTLDRIFFAH